MFSHKKCLYQLGIYSSPQKSTTFLPGESNDIIFIYPIIHIDHCTWNNQIHTDKLNKTRTDLHATFLATNFKRTNLILQIKVPLYNLSGHVRNLESSQIKCPYLSS